MKILVSGFEPFDQLNTNPSEQIVELLLQESYNFNLQGIILPVSFERAFIRLENKINLLKPDYVICLGVAVNRNVITPERLAINYKEASIADNDGVQPQGAPVLNGEVDGLITSLPIKQMALEAKALGVEAEVSNTAGTYVCNDLMYKVINHSKSNGYLAGFIHVPPVEKQSLEQLLIGIKAMINYCANDQ